MTTKPAFQRRHYEALARALSISRARDKLYGRNTNGTHEGIDRVEAALIEVLSRDNPQFKPEQFISAASLSAAPYIVKGDKA